MCGPAVVARCDASPVLEFGEEVLDFVALAVGRLVIVERRLGAFVRWNAGWVPGSFSALRNQLLS